VLPAFKTEMTDVMSVLLLTLPVFVTWNRSKTVAFQRVDDKLTKGWDILDAKSS